MCSIVWCPPKQGWLVWCTNFRFAAAVEFPEVSRLHRGPHKLEEASKWLICYKVIRTLMEGHEIPWSMWLHWRGLTEELEEKFIVKRVWGRNRYNKNSKRFAERKFKKTKRSQFKILVNKMEMEMITTKNKIVFLKKYPTAISKNLDRNHKWINKTWRTVQTYLKKM